jgi:hypothetical protein
MTKRGKSRKFPYYIVVEVDAAEKKMLLLDLNSIQWEEHVDRDGRKTSVFHYIEEADQHDLKWITVPGAKVADQKSAINWIEEMVFPDGMLDEEKYMVYDHRRHFTDPFHEEYKVQAFRDWEAAQVSEDETEDDEEIVLEEETEDEE